MITIFARNAPEAYAESYWIMKANAKPENSRAGPVLAMPAPTILEISHPMERVITDVARDCNPFFHVMETIWMFAGSDKVDFPAMFNSGYRQYAEDNGVVHGAYGKRWRDHFQPAEIGPRFKMDQIQLAIAILRKDPESRQVVLGMWDPSEDLGAKKRDRPCNTHIYFRHVDGGLDMTVCNRSNDLLWGMLGANIVHMTYLHELVAFGSDLAIGAYRVFTNNLHVYTENDVTKRFMTGPVRHDVYLHATPTPLLVEGETVEDFLRDCEDFVNDRKFVSGTVYKTKWMNEVAVPMYLAYLCKEVEYRLELVDTITAEDWRVACRQWIVRKTQSSVTSTGR